MREIKKDIFEWIEENRKDNVVFLLHCISADWALGTGIAKAIDEKFDERERLNRTFLWNGSRPDWTGHGSSLTTPILTVEEVSPHLHICNLVTKEHYWDKPTYTTLYEALEHSRTILETAIPYAKRDGLGFKVVMPKIGCGLDKLDWRRVREMIIQWAGLDLDVTVCYL